MAENEPALEYADYMWGEYLICQKRYEALVSAVKAAE